MSTSEGPQTTGAPGPDDLPRLPQWLAEPANVVYVGMACWLVATVVVAATGLGTTSTLVSCLVGLAVGLFGTAVFTVQRRASRRGDRAAQRGLD
ncbi:DUF2530 domain-containing protein [uncultured Williamsia sp.]|uniref:DUF2530 domain-containing protein n=1 Tax=uncultured Williamsia sp. TaxID=259311 RepID=UPI00262AF496|nr:DUF2530 domain-containing protein [uncultured Williamsia sp.]